MNWCHLYYLLKDLQRKAARVVASKCALAARVDSFHESPRGEAGEGQFNNELYLRKQCTHMHCTWHILLKECAHKCIWNLTQSLGGCMYNSLVDY